MRQYVLNHSHAVSGISCRTQLSRNMSSGIDCISFYTLKLVNRKIQPMKCAVKVAIGEIQRQGSAVVFTFCIVQKGIIQIKCIYQFQGNKLLDPLIVIVLTVDLLLYTFCLLHTAVGDMIYIECHLIASLFQSYFVMLICMYNTSPIVRLVQAWC